jgi:hypothetical protein
MVAATPKGTPEDVLQAVQNAKKKMVIEMALDFTAMTWLFPTGSTTKILQRLEAAFAGFDRIREQKDYDQMHAEFCVWFTQNIDRAQKKKQREKFAPVLKSSYGQAAKVLDIAAKVYVYYCAMRPRSQGLLRRCYMALWITRLSNFCSASSPK